MDGFGKWGEGREIEEPEMTPQFSLENWLDGVGTRRGSDLEKGKSRICLWIC